MHASASRERGGGGLDIIQKSQLTRIERLGEMKAEERIADRPLKRVREM